MGTRRASLLQIGVPIGDRAGDPTIVESLV